MDVYNQLDLHIREGIEAFKNELVRCFGEGVCAVYLTGSAAEARVRVHSDVNLVVVVEEFAEHQAKDLREAYRMARAAVNLNAMFLKRDEVAKAVDAFPVKFVDIQTRHHLLHGKDVFADCPISSDKLAVAIKQNILNARLRLRERFVLVGLRREQLARVVAEHASSLRAGAFSLLYLEGKSASSPREALSQICVEAGSSDFSELLYQISAIREKGAFDGIDADAVVFGLMKLTDLLSDRLEKAVKGS